jgi:excisionase family DNA binding protein
MSTAPQESLVDVTEAGRSLGVSVSTIWRMIRRGALPSVRRGGRRWIPREALQSGARERQPVRPLTEDHPIFRLVGAGRSGGQIPGARDKHTILDQ